jgi:hypothetical protein
MATTPTARSTPKTQAITANTGNSQATWARVVLADAGAPVTQNNIDNIVRWMAAENPAKTWWRKTTLNPLNIGPGGKFASLAAAAKKTAYYIATDKTYAPIIAALRATATSETFYKAVASTPWDATHYSDDNFGKNPVPTLYPSPTATGAPQPGTGTSAAGGVKGTGPTGSSSSGPTGCAIGFGGVLGLGKICFVTHRQARAIEGIGIMVVGGIPLVLGFVGLLVIGLGRTKGAQALAKTPGPLGAAAGAVVATGSPRRSSAATGAPAGRPLSPSVSERVVREDERHKLLSETRPSRSERRAARNPEPFTEADIGPAKRPTKGQGGMIAPGRQSKT